jgi:hypothetical protein
LGKTKTFERDILDWGAGMNRALTGFLAGGLVGAGIGLSYLVSDRRNRARLLKKGKRFLKKGRAAMEDISDFF